MKLESLKSSKFEAMSEAAMMHVVGGQVTETGKSDKGSNDYQTTTSCGTNCSTTTTTYPLGGGDISKIQMDKVLSTGQLQAEPSGSLGVVEQTSSSQILNV